MLFQIGQNYCDTTERILMDSHKLELWPGYVTSIRQHEKELLLCVDLTHEVMRQHTAYQAYKECLESNTANPEVTSKSLASCHPQFVLFKNDSQWNHILRPQVEDP
jgi:aubergine-like protein